MKHEYLECGKIINIHGFRGAVKLESFCDTPRDLAALPVLWLEEKGAYRPVKVKKASVLGAFVIAELEGVTDEEQANALRGRIVYAAREDLRLSVGAFFLADVIGLPVKHVETGEALGTVLSVDTRGKNALFTVKTPNGEALLPNVAEFVKRVDIEDAVYVLPIPGLLDGGSENV